MYGAVTLAFVVASMDFSRRSSQSPNTVVWSQQLPLGMYRAILRPIVRLHQTARTTTTGPFNCERCHEESYSYATHGRQPANKGKWVRYVGELYLWISVKGLNDTLGQNHSLRMVAQTFAKTQGLTYLAGHFWEHMPYTLMWFWQNDQGYDAFEDRIVGAPSWSWVSARIPVLPNKRNP